MSKRRRDLRRKSRSGDQNDMSGMSSKQMRNAMNQIQTDEVKDVVEVIVRTKNEEIILHNPEVTVMNMGQEVWSVVPQRVERKLMEMDTSPVIPPEEVEVKENDVKLIMTTAKVSEAEAIEALKTSGGDLAAAMIKLRD